MVWLTIPHSLGSVSSQLEVYNGPQGTGCQGPRGAKILSHGAMLDRAGGPAGGTAKLEPTAVAAVTEPRDTSQNGRSRCPTLGVTAGQSSGCGSGGPRKGFGLIPVWASAPRLIAVPRGPHPHGGGHSEGLRMDRATSSEILCKAV